MPCIIFWKKELCSMYAVHSMYVFFVVFCLIDCFFICMCHNGSVKMRRRGSNFFWSAVFKAIYAIFILFCHNWLKNTIYSHYVMATLCEERSRCYFLEGSMKNPKSNLSGMQYKGLIYIHRTMSTKLGTGVQHNQLP